MRQPKEFKNAQHGFTVVELLIATVVFSVVLIIITSGVLHFTKSYYKSVHVSSTQNAARNVIDTIAQNFQYGGGTDAFTDAKPADNDKAMCIGNIQMNYRTGAMLGSPDTTYGVFVSTKTDAGGECKPYDPLLKGRELLGKKMRLTDLKVTKVIGGAGNTYKITAGVAYGEIDLLCSTSVTPSTAAGGCDQAAPAFADYKDLAVHGSKVICKGGSGSQFCAFSHLSTQVVARFEPAGL